MLKGISVIRQNYEKVKIQIAFRPVDQTFEVCDATTKKNPEFIPDISILWSPNCPRRKFERDFFTRLRKSREVTQEEEDHLSEVIDKLYDIQNYPFTALELSQSVDEEQVADVFVRINSKGTLLL